MYVCYASRYHREFEDALNSAGYIVRNQIIWVKTLATFGWGDYRWKHEPIFYAVPKEGGVEFYGDRSQYTEWSEELTDAQLLKRVKSMIEKDESGGSTIWKLKKDSHYKHPTQKPMQLVETALKNSSKLGDTVIDFFAGSGTTLMACEKLNRKCLAIEIDTRYCDVIIERWIS